MRMDSNPNHCDQPFVLLWPDIIQESWNSNGDGSYAFLLPERRKGKTKPAGKVHNVPLMSKSKQKKLKQLQEEKEKKLLQSKSIKILEKYKIWEGAYSLLHSSGTIGQAETMQEKCRRVVQLSKAGLEAPESFSPLKKKSKQRGSCGIELASELDPDGSYPELNCCDDDLVLVKCTEGDDCNHSQYLGSYLKPAIKSPPNVERSPSVLNDKNPSSISYSHSKGENTNSKAIMASNFSVPLLECLQFQNFINLQAVRCTFSIYWAKKL